MNRIIVVLICFLMASISIAQPICGFDEGQQKLLANPEYAEKIRLTEMQIQGYIAANPFPPAQNGPGTALYTIPVVVHVVHTGGEIGTLYNIDELQVNSVLTYLNQAFDGTAAGFFGGVGDIQIQFQLARRDPNCNPTNGIDRVDGSVLSGYTTYGVKRHGANGVTDLALKNQSRWDPARYYNIWVVNKIDGADGNSSGQFVAGYAGFAGIDPNLDGAVMLSSQMYSGSTILPHEMGHALNLYHVFEGSSLNTSCPANTSCSSQGDRVCDTDPITYNISAGGTIDFSCRTGTNPCTNTAFSINTENNVMNYTRCNTLFTAGQKTRMLAAMSLSARASLANSTALEYTYSNVSPCVPKINFEKNAVKLTETTSATVDCRGYKDYSFNMTIGNSPSQAATATITATGTATPGLDYLLTTNGNFSSTSNTITFPTGTYNSKSFTIRVFDDAAVEINETIILNFTVNNGGGNAVKGEAIPTLTITIVSNDNANPQPSVMQTATIGSYSSNLTTGSGNHPFNSKLASKRNSFLYKASELTAMGLTAGDITAFGVYLFKNSTRPFTNLQIRIGTTSLNYLVDGSLNNVSGTTVKTLASYNTVNGLNLFQLDLPFTWNGTSNLVVQVCYDNGTADAGELSDVCQGYSDGGGSSQGNMFWQDGINCNTSYSSVSYFQSGVKPVAYFVIGSNGPQIETQLNATGTAYLGPNEDVFFYSGNGNLLARIKNLSAFDYGCTQVKIDRAGNTSKGYINNNTADAVMDKTIQVIPANNNANGSYEITLYYKLAEIQGWKTATGKLFNGTRLYKTPGAVSSYTPGQVPMGLVTSANPVFGTYGVDSTITATFTNGFSGFAVGGSTIITQNIYIFMGDGLWTNPANWTNNMIPPSSLPAGSTILISPQPDGQCILNVAQNILPGATLNVGAGKNFVIQGKLDVVN